MKKNKKCMLCFIALTTVLIFSFCENSTEIVISSNNLLLGNWVDATYNTETASTVFKRGNSLPNDAYGISFYENGNFKESSSGFCGTPPLSFFTINGTYTFNKEVITISTDSYLGNYSWRVLHLSENKLEVKRELTAQELDYEQLMVLFNEISNLAYSQTCTNAKEWTYTAVGAKGCGGPKGYLPYSIKIDTTAFLKKVENYTKAEQKYNVKWGIISDCAIANPPKNIECQNGYPVLNY